MSPKFVVAKHSSQTLRGLRQLCEALNSNAKFHFYLVIHNVYDTLKKSSSFRTFRRLHEICEAFNSNYTSRFHGEQFIQDFTTTLVMHQARLILPLHLQSFGGLNRVWPFLKNSEFFCCAHLFPAPKETRHSNDPNTPYRSTYLFQAPCSVFHGDQVIQEM